VETKVQIKTVHALHSEAEQVPSSSEENSIKAGWHATLLAPFKPRAQVRLFPEADPRWKDMIDESVWLQRVDMDEARDEATVALPCFQVRITEKNEYTILVGSYDQMPDLPAISTSSADALRQIVTILEHLAKFANIEGLDNQSSDCLLESDFSIELKAKDDPSKKLSGNRLQIEDEGKLLVIFKNYTDKPLNLTVFDMRPLRQVLKLYPSADRGDWKVVLPNQVKNGISFPGEISFTVKMTIPDSLKAKGRSQVEDVLKFFVTTRPTSFAALELPELSEQTLKPKRSSNCSLFPFLQELSAYHQPDAVLRNETGKLEEKWACRNFTICATMALGGFELM
jgi:hypothetical protein